MDICLLVSMFLWVWWIWLYGSVDITHVNKIYVGDAICDYEGISTSRQPLFYSGERVFIVPDKYLCHLGVFPP